MTPGPAAPVPAEPARAPEPRAWWRWAVAVAYMALLFGVSSLSRLPELPMHPSDKTLHSLAYAVLGLLVTWALAHGRPERIGFRTVMLATIICAAYGYSDEFHQRFVPGRDYDLWDLVADTAGAFAGSGLLWAWGIIARGSGPHDDV